MRIYKNPLQANGPDRRSKTSNLGSRLLPKSRSLFLHTIISEMPRTWSKPYIPILRAHESEWRDAPDKTERMDVVETVANEILDQIWGSGHNRGTGKGTGDPVPEDLHEVSDPYTCCRSTKLSLFRK